MSDSFTIRFENVERPQDVTLPEDLPEGYPIPEVLSVGISGYLVKNKSTGNRHYKFGFILDLTDLFNLGVFKEELPVSDFTTTYYYDSSMPEDHTFGFVGFAVDK